jgi:hypothetical protein
MKKTFKLIGIAVMLAAIAFSMAACSDDSGGSGGGGGGGGSGGGGGGGSGGGKTLTVTDIPSQYNGLYAYALIYSKDYTGTSGCLWGNDPGEYNTPKYSVLISNGKVTLPLWEFNSNPKDPTNYYKRYTGNNFAGNRIDFTLSGSIDGRAHGEYYPTFIYYGPPDITFSNSNTTLSLNIFED